MKVKVPASTTNFGSGFDSFGLALNLFNEFYVEESENYKVTYEGHSLKGEDLFLKAYRFVCKEFGREAPVEVRQRIRVPIGRGLGSSATAIVGGIESALKILREEVPLKEKLRWALNFEPHPDNLIPAFVGGFTLIYGEDFLKLSFPEELNLYFLVPDFEISTNLARKVLKREVSLEDAVFNLRRSSLFIYSLLKREFSLLSLALEDKIHQPYRIKLIRGGKEVMERAKSLNLPIFISGSGPSLCIISQEDGEGEVKELKNYWESFKVKVSILKLKASDFGVNFE